jgi:hypothetical protein
VELALSRAERIPWDRYTDLDPDDGDSCIVAELLHAKGMTDVGKLIVSHDIKMRILAVPPDYSQKWDVADAVQKNQWTPEQVLAFIEVESAPIKRAGLDTDGETNPYFRILGYDRSTYYFKRVNHPQLITLNGGSSPTRRSTSGRLKTCWQKTATVRGEAKAGDGSDGATSSLAASRLRVNRNHATRVSP